MADLFDDSFDLSFDDSDLVPLFARQQLASQQSQQQKQKAKDTTIVLLDDDDDDDDKEKDDDDDKEKKGGTPTKRRSAQPPPKKSPKKRSSSVEVITLLDSDSEKEEMSSSPSKGASNAGKKLPTFSFSSSSSSSSPSPSPEREPPFTALKKVPSAQSSQSSPSSSPRAEAAEEPYWDPFGNDDFDDQFLPPLPRRFLPQSTRSTPSKAKVISSSSTSTISSKGLLIRSTKKLLSGKKPTKLLKTSSTITTTTTTVTAKANKKRNLFTSKTTTTVVDDHLFTTFTSSSLTTSSALPAIRNKEEAITHLTVHLSSSYLHDLLSADLEKMAELAGKRLKVKVAEEEDDDNDLLPTITWTASPSLRELLTSIEEIKGAVRTVKGGRSSANLLDQVLVFLSADELHSCVAKYVSGGGDEEGDEEGDDDNGEDDDLFKQLQQITHHLSASNLTLIIFGLEAYLKGQQRRANRQFRRQLEDLMAAEEQTAQQQQQKKRVRRKKKSTEASVGRIDLNLDNIELMLTDVRMRFHFLGGNESDQGRGGHLPHFTVQYVDTAEQLAALLWKYSRSLAEAVWRLSARKISALSGDLFAEGNPLNSIDPSLGVAARADLWRRQLQQFHGISASAAEAIASRWPSPRALYQALRAAADPVGLLAATPLANSRRFVGEELAVKIATFMVTSEPGRLLKSGTCKT